MRRTLVILIALLAGIGILVYPHVSNYLIERNGSYTLESYDEELAKLNEKELSALWKEAEIYNENLTGSPVHDPFVPNSGVAMPDNYYAVLKKAGIMGQVEIPKINVNLPIYHGTSDSVLQKAVGHLEGSTLPIGGKSRHSVLTGHTGLVHAKLFTDLVELKKGDQFYIHVLGRTLAYQVNQIKVINPDVTEDLRVTKGKDFVTLLTCTPYGVNSHRLLVRGERIPYDPDAKKAIEPVTGLTAEQWAMVRAGAITAIIMSMLIVVVLIRNRRYKKIQKNG